MRTRSWSPTLVAVFVAALLLGLSASTALAAPPPGAFFQGFEKNRDGWFDSTNGGFGLLVRQQSGYSNGGGYADGINSFAGRWHARLTGDCSWPAGATADCFGPFTRWGGYTGVFPPGGYKTEVAIYLDGQGPDHSLREFANRGPERRVLGRKFEVQLRR